VPAFRSRSRENGPTPRSAPRTRSADGIAVQLLYQRQPLQRPKLRCCAMANLLSLHPRQRSSSVSASQEGSGPFVSCTALSHRPENRSAAEFRSIALRRIVLLAGLRSRPDWARPLPSSERSANETHSSYQPCCRGNHRSHGRRHQWPIFAHCGHSLTGWPDACRVELIEAGRCKLFPNTGFYQRLRVFTETSSTIALLGPEEHRQRAGPRMIPLFRARLGSVGRPSCQP